MNMTTRLVISATMVGLVACASYTPIPIPVIGTRASIDSIAGEWQGSYRSEETGRSGTINFSLRVGRDTAFGEVIMIPATYHVPIAPMNERVGEPRRAPSLLTITFVRIADDRVRGTLDPYLDPDCMCPMRTVFTGRLANANTMEGSFESQRSDIATRVGGTWTAKRIANPGAIISK